MNMKKIRKDFPILGRKISGKKLVYLDNAATTQKPKAVIDALDEYYEQRNSNVHRGVHTLAEEATEAYEESRKKLARFINADRREIIFTRGTTEAINLVKFSLGFEKGDEIVTTVMEHHSNIVPWLMLKKKGIAVKFVDVNEDGLLEEEQYDDLITEKTKLVTVAHVSNVLGTINDVKKIAGIAHDSGALCLVDAAQSVPHMPVDVKQLQCDFLALSGHKMLGPTGSGALYGKKQLLEEMEPFQGGGEMIKTVSTEKATWNDLPWKFEAGTPNIADSIVLGAAVDYLQKAGMKNIREHEKDLTKYALSRLSEVKGLTIYGPEAGDRGGVVSFNLGDIHAHDLASVLNDDGIAVRSGHHCAMPLHTRLGIVATARASFYLYNTPAEIDKLVASLKRARKVFRL
ncbi:MAG: cysteine desulfurase [Candidatus Aenigmarchaeota archaeon]|nr:cysteine desulfurase [Candidatus Aenigmarchaeota archaeon]